MEILRPGSRGSEVQFLQLALRRAGYSPGNTDGVFGPRTQEAVRRFQRHNALMADGVAGPRTHAALTPWYRGYRIHVLRPGDTYYRLAARYGSTVRAIDIANPGLDPLRLPVGRPVTIPLAFSVIPEDIIVSSALVENVSRGLAARYPALRAETVGRSVLGRPLLALTAGRGGPLVLANAAHHANEWITALMCLRIMEQLARADAFDEELDGRAITPLLDAVSLTLVPAVDPDGVDLVTGALHSGDAYRRAQLIAADYPDIPFPSGWKANILGVDLNLQYPALWETARDIKYAQGYRSPAPRDYVGEAPLTAPESVAMAALTRRLSPDLTLSFHTQGQVIFWQFQNYAPPDSLTVGARLALASTYPLADTPYEASFAGYKDWYLQEYRRPGYTVEAGLGENPLPLSQLSAITAACRPLLLEALSAIAPPQ